MGEIQQQKNRNSKKQRKLSPVQRICIYSFKKIGEWEHCQKSGELKGWKKNSLPNLAKVQGLLKNFPFFLFSFQFSHFVNGFTQNGTRRFLNSGIIMLECIGSEIGSENLKNDVLTALE